jgi:hypothetical protein
MQTAESAFRFLVPSTLAAHEVFSPFERYLGIQKVQCRANWLGRFSKEPRALKGSWKLEGMERGIRYLEKGDSKAFTSIGCRYKRAWINYVIDGLAFCMHQNGHFRGTSSR